MIVQVEISDTAVPLALISAGFLSRDAGENRAAIADAIAGYWKLWWLLTRQSTIHRCAVRFPPN